MIFNFMRVEVSPELNHVGPGLTSLDFTVNQVADAGFNTKISFYAVTKEEIAELGKELIALSKKM